MPHFSVCAATTSVCPADTITRLRKIGLTVVDVHGGDKDRTVINCRPLAVEDTCLDCGFAGRGSAVRHLVDIPISGHRFLLAVSSRLVCTNPDCERTVWCTAISCAAPRTKLTYQCIRWSLMQVAAGKVSAAAVSRKRGVDWATVHSPLAKAAWELVYNYS